MSKVKIQGHASGTGVFTLTSPNSGTDRTISLPDGSGTLAFTTGDDDKLPLSGGTLTGVLKGVAGSVSAPSFAFSTNVNTGLGFVTNKGLFGTAMGLKVFQVEKINNNSHFAIGRDSNFSDNSTVMSLELGGSTSLTSGVAVGEFSGTVLQTNSRYTDSGDLAIATGRITRSAQYYGQQWFDYSYASAGAGITWNRSLTLDYGGDVTVGTGDLIFGTAGKGIVLGATTNVDANTLDDYEEGTWTPNVGGNASYTVQNGTYVKVGKMCTVACEMHINVIGNAGSYGTLQQVRGLPFNSIASPSHASSGAVGYCSGLSSNFIAFTLRIDANTNVVNSATQSADGSSTRVSENLWTSGSRVLFSITYITA